MKPAITVEIEPDENNPVRSALIELQEAMRYLLDNMEFEEPPAPIYSMEVSEETEEEKMRGFTAQRQIAGYVPSVEEDEIPEETAEIGDIRPHSNPAFEYVFDGNGWQFRSKKNDEAHLPEPSVEAGSPEGA